MAVTILTEAELRDCVRLDEATVDAIADGFARLSRGEVEMPPIMHISVPEHEGDVDIKSAYVRGLDRFAVKIGAGFFNNHRLGLPNSPASVVMVSARTGVVEAVLLDNAFLTDLRTGAAGAVAARHLAPTEVETAGIIGAGVQARWQAEALCVVRRPGRVLVWSRDGAKTKAFADEMTRRLGIPVEAAPSAEAVVRESQAVVTTTPSKEPLVKAAWLHPGLHITAVGADLKGKQEVEAAVLEQAGRVVCDRRAQCSAMGELQHARLPEDRVAELGEVVAGTAPGRPSEDAVTICDLTGTGMQDTVIGNIALDRALERGMGVRVG